MDALRPFQWIVYQQDYLWYLVALAWASVLVGWWRIARPHRALAWVPWAGSLGILTAAFEISQIVTPSDVEPWTAPWLVCDLLLGGVYAMAAAACWWEVRRRQGGWRRLVSVALATIAVASGPLRYAYPRTGSCVIAGLLTAGALTAAWRARRGERFGLTAWALSIWSGTAGPLAELLNEPHRYSEISVFGPWAAGCGLAASIAVGCELYGLAVSGDSTSREAETLELRQLVRNAALWLGLGLVLAAIMGWWGRTGFERNIASRVEVSAELLDRDLLAKTLGPGFHLDKVFGFDSPTGDSQLAATSAFLGRGIQAPLSRRLTTMEFANPDILSATIVAYRDGWQITCCFSSRYPGNPSDVGVTRRASGLDLVAAQSRRSSVVGPLSLPYGMIVQARMPLFSRQNQLLGWLAFDLGVAHWVAAQAQARILAFAVVSLGLGLIVLNGRQRRREREREAARREAAAAAAASQVKSAFLAKVSHELRTPIQSLLGYSELLRQRVSDDPKASIWLASLRQQGELMTRLVNDLIDLGAVDAGAFKLACKTIALADMVTQAVESFRPRADSKGLNLACFIDPNVPPAVSADGERIRQIITNVLGNAVKFTDRGGVTVSLGLEHGVRSLTKPGDADQSTDLVQLMLVVRDTGPGIPVSEQGRLFSAFSRLEATATKEGSGLGLALSAALCRAMGGTLTVQSDGVTGSQFIATFQVRPAAILATESMGLPAASLRGRKVLVVDDNPLVRELFVAFLTEQGALCAAAGNGAEALAQAATDAFDVVVLDLALPDIDGAEVARRLRGGIERDRLLRLVGVSAHAGSADRARALAAGMDVFLTKPVPLGEMAVAVAGDDRVIGAETLPFRTGSALRERLTRQFRGELPGQRAELAAAVTARNWVRARTLAHHLKNSAVVVLDDALFDACTGLEEASAAAGDESVILMRWTRCVQAMDRWTQPRDNPLSPSVT